MKTPSKTNATESAMIPIAATATFCKVSGKTSHTECIRMRRFGKAICKWKKSNENILEEQQEIVHSAFDVSVSEIQNENGFQPILTNSFKTQCDVLLQIVPVYPFSSDLYFLQPITTALWRCWPSASRKNVRAE